MKLKNFVAAAFAALPLLVACGKDAEPGTEPEKSLTAPELTASAAEVTITGTGEDVVLSLTWTAASTEVPVTYSLECTKEGGEKVFKCGTSMEKSFTAKEIDELKSEFGAGEEDVFSLVFRVQAESSQVLLPVYSETVSVKFTYDIPVVYDLNLYPVGDCFEWGWDKSKAAKMETSDNVRFTWTGTLTAGEGYAFKFLTEEAVLTDSWYPSYNRDGDSDNYWALVERRSEADPDRQFAVEKGGECTITVDLGTMVVALSYKEAEKRHIYGIGDAFDWKWKLADAEEFMSSDNESFTWTGNAGAGAFKFMCSNEKWLPSYNRNKSAEDEWTAFYRDSDSQPDDQFSLPSDGNWTIKLNVAELKVSAVRNGNRTDVKPSYEYDGLWIYGSIIPDFNWELAGMLKMETSDNVVFTCEGEFVGGPGKSFKFMCHADKWWPAFVRDGEETTSLKMRYGTSGADDTPFFLTESGRYRITADIGKMEVTLEKL